MKVNFTIFFLIIININLFASFIKKENIIIDSRTNLMWQDDSDAKNNNRIWRQALKYCENLTLGGYTNWRLPNVIELASIVDNNKHNPSTHRIFENVISDNYWSSTSASSYASYAWAIEFYLGRHSWESKPSLQYIRCVRSN